MLAWSSRKLGSKGGFALLFFLLFTITWIPIIATVLAAGKSFFWIIDGLSQQYVWFVYTGQWLRDVASAIFVDHTFEIPQWTMDAGYGSDIILSFSSSFANPFYWISALVPERYAEFAFEFMLLLCLYTAGLAFSAWAIHRGCQRSATLIAALCYVFAGNVTVIFTQQSFIFMLLIAPLAALGADRVFERRGCGLFVVVMAWSFLLSFYDSYMLCILLLIYCLLVFFFRVESGRASKGRFKRLLGWFGLFVALIVAALLASCILLLPKVLSLVGDSRMSLERSNEALYALGVYESMFSGFITRIDMGRDSIGGVNALAALALVMLALRRRSHKGIAVAFIALTVMMLLPFFGRLMNGFQYPANRWTWAYDLMMAYMVAELLPEMLAASRHERHVLAGIAIAYGAIVLVLPLPGRTMSFAIAYVVLIGMVAVITSARNWDRRKLYASVASLAMLSGAVTFCCALSPYFSAEANSLVGFGKTWQFHSNLGVDGLIDQAEGYDENYRYDRESIEAGYIHNSGLITGHMTPDYYNSFYNQGIDDFNASLGLVDTEGLNFRYGGLNGRSELEAPLGVKYYYLSSGDDVLLPKQFKDSDPIAQGSTWGGDHELYETDDVAPLAYVVDDYVTTDEYYARDMVDRGDLLLDAIVLDTQDVTEGMTDVSDELTDNSTDLAYEVTSVNDITVEDGAILTTGDDSYIEITFDSPADAEAFVNVEGLTYSDTSLRERYTDEAWEDLGFIGRLKVLLESPFQIYSTSGCVHVQINDRIAGILYPRTPSDAQYSAKDDWACNVGYSDGGKVTVKLRFTVPGRYSFDSLSVSALSMDGYEERVSELKEAGATDIEIGTNSIEATATSSTDAQLFFSVAYSDGWSATVDGEPAEIHRADLGFMSVDIPEGTHRVVLTYRSPHLALGAALSAVGVVLCILICVTVGARWRKRRAGSGALIAEVGETNRRQPDETSRKLSAECHTTADAPGMTPRLMEG